MSKGNDIENAKVMALKIPKGNGIENALVIALKMPAVIALTMT